MALGYDLRYRLPFPTLPVRVLQVDNGKISVVLTGLVDTGADGTLVPAQILQELGVEALYRARLRSHWGEWRSAGIFVVDLQIEQVVLPAVEVIADEASEDVLLGRNVLNSLILLLDGPSKRLDLLDKRPRRL